MIIKGYGIELVRLKHEDIEMIRNWRNSEHIRRSMEFREHITPEMQESWFRSIDNIHNNYFIIIANNEKVGLINGSKIDWEKRETGNGGIFIWDENHLKSLTPLKASLLLTDLSFHLGMERTYIKVLSDNPASISYNLSLGYELLPGQEGIYNQRYVLNRENYFKKTRKLKQALMKTESPKITVLLDDQENPASRQLQKMYEQLSDEEKKQLNFVIK